MRYDEEVAGSGDNFAALGFVRFVLGYEVVFNMNFSSIVRFSS